MRKINFVILFFLVVTLISFSSAQLPNLVSTSTSGTIGIAKSNDTIQLTQLCANCTYVNLTQIIYPNQSYAFLGQLSMTKNGNNFNYSFSNTTTLGDYYYTTCGDLNGVNTCQTVSFIVTPSGQEFTLASTISSFIPALIMMLMMFGFLFLGAMSNSKSLKWVFVILSSAFFVFTISYSISLSIETLSQYPSLYNWVIAFLKVFSISISVGVLIIVVYTIILVIKKVFDERMGKALDRR